MSCIYKEVYISVNQRLQILSKNSLVDKQSALGNPKKKRDKLLGMGAQAFYYSLSKNGEVKI